MGDHASRGRGLSAAAAPAVYPEDHAPSDAEEEAGRRLFAQACVFVAGAVNSDAIPPDALPEIAFAGRSNVGKSSLVNALTGRSTLARVSHAPGRTRQLNFFILGNRLMLVDLPGYGYAASSRREIEQWTAFTRLYMRGRASLRRVLLLIDARHGVKPADREVMDVLDESAVSFLVVLTKSDKLSAAALKARLASTADEIKSHVAAHPAIHATSAREGFGIAALRAALASLAGP